jgi:hypothetical protein
MVRATTLGGDGIEPSGSHHFDVRAPPLYAPLPEYFNQAITRNAVPLSEDRSRPDSDDIDAEAMQFMRSESLRHGTNCGTARRNSRRRQFWRPRPYPPHSAGFRASCILSDWKKGIVRVQGVRPNPASTGTTFLVGQRRESRRAAIALINRVPSRISLPKHSPSGQFFSVQLSPVLFRNHAEGG